MVIITHQKRFNLLLKKKKKTKPQNPTTFDELFIIYIKKCV